MSTFVSSSPPSAVPSAAQLFAQNNAGSGQIELFMMDDDGNIFPWYKASDLAWEKGSGDESAQIPNSNNTSSGQNSISFGKDGQAEFDFSHAKGDSAEPYLKTSTATSANSNESVSQYEDFPLVANDSTSTLVALSSDGGSISVVQPSRNVIVTNDPTDTLSIKDLKYISGFVVIEDKTNSVTDIIEYKLLIRDNVIISQPMKTTIFSSDDSNKDLVFSIETKVEVAGNYGYLQISINNPDNDQISAISKNNLINLIY